MVLTAISRCAALAAAALATVALAGCGSGHRTARTGPGFSNAVLFRVPARLGPQQRALFKAGEVVLGETGCLACHVIDGIGDNGPGPALSHVGAHRSAAAIASALTHPTAPMPSYSSLAAQHPKQFNQLVAFIADLR